MGQVSPVALIFSGNVQEWGKRGGSHGQSHTAASSGMVGQDVTRAGNTSRSSQLCQGDVKCLLEAFSRGRGAPLPAPSLLLELENKESSRVLLHLLCPKKLPPDWPN